LLALLFTFISSFLSQISYSHFLQLTLSTLAILGAMVACLAPMPSPLGGLIDYVKQYAARKPVLRKYFKSCLKDVKLKASVELQGHDKWR
jgi:hypothetical protein